MTHASLQKITGRQEKLTGYRRTRRDMGETGRIHAIPLGYGRNFWDIGETYGILEKLTGYGRN